MLGKEIIMKNTKFTCKPIYGAEPKFDLWADNKPVIPSDYAGTVKTPYVQHTPKATKSMRLIKHKLETSIKWFNQPGKVMKVTTSGMPILGVKYTDHRVNPTPYKTILDVFKGLETRVELKMNKNIHKFIGTATVFAIDEATGAEFDIAIFTACRGYHYEDNER